ncbi:Transposase OS=Streptomyces microflavus OX=1919 GN=Smic_02590 PE=4 SV=1 [Streptomyces microflavus]|uniref:Uncharacterized protein n=1 Tax=Streptomyces microflavus TaxID=1919 RepID=A0A7J0CGR3_STRMI|nr:hypothetical protein Smic_02590 [Streptomyces microflavus]
MRAAREAGHRRRTKNRKVPRRGNDNAAVERMVRTVIRRRKRSLREQDVTVTDPPKARDVWLRVPHLWRGPER